MFTALLVSAIHQAPSARQEIARASTDPTGNWLTRERHFQKQSWELNVCGKVSYLLMPFVTTF
jgi:hypothetical protein